ncbi:hypothetical protein [Microbacterium sp. LMI1-1-1.1]|uniref:hypothetical protein n=1 Tax=unclassified Microbacterium TaxID=2609290 RepID=UPI003466688B
MKRSPAAAAVLLAASLLLTACTAPAENGGPIVQGGAPNAEPSNSAGVMTPTIVAPDELDGTTVTAVVGAAVVLTVPEGSEGEWAGSEDDPTIAEFSAGGMSEGGSFQPSFIARGTGTTGATLVGPDGGIVHFTIEVTAP